MPDPGLESNWLLSVDSLNPGETLAKANARVFSISFSVEDSRNSHPGNGKRNLFPIFSWREHLEYLSLCWPLVQCAMLTRHENTHVKVHTPLLHKRDATTLTFCGTRQLPLFPQLVYPLRLAPFLSQQLPRTVSY